MTNVEYWNSMEFEYLIYYSLFRGEKFEHYLLAIEDEIKQKALLAAKSGWYQKTEIDAEISALKRSKSVHRVKVIDTNLKFHLSAEQIKLIETGGREIKSLENIFNLPYQRGGPVSLCIPVYRDALVFYGRHNEIISSLNICFKCLHIVDGNNNRIEVDGEVFYPALAALLHSWPKSSIVGK